jgi:hypothetical protein
LFAASRALTANWKVARVVALPGELTARCVTELLTTEIALDMPPIEAVVISVALIVVVF